MLVKEAPDIVSSFQYGVFSPQALAFYFEAGARTG